jgi:hypothetical protein
VLEAHHPRTLSEGGAKVVGGGWWVVGGFSPSPLDFTAIAYPKAEKHLLVK